MKNRLGLLFAVVICAVLAFVAVHEIKKDQTTGVKRGSELIFPVNARNVQELTVTLEGKSATFTRGAGGFVLASGPQEAAPDTVVDFIGAWSRIRFFEVVEENVAEQDLEKFGLRSPAVVARARVKNEDGEVKNCSLEVGKAAAAKQGFYARVDGFPRVVVVSVDAIGLSILSGRRLFGMTPVELPGREKKSQTSP